MDEERPNVLPPLVPPSGIILHMYLLNSHPLFLKGHIGGCFCSRNIPKLWYLIKLYHRNTYLIFVNGSPIFIIIMTWIGHDRSQSPHMSFISIKIKCQWCMASKIRYIWKKSTCSWLIGPPLLLPLSRVVQDVQQQHWRLQFWSYHHCWLLYDGCGDSGQAPWLPWHSRRLFHWEVWSSESVYNDQPQNVSIKLLRKWGIPRCIWNHCNNPSFG